MIFWLIAACLSALGVGSLWRGIFTRPVTRRAQIAAVLAAVLIPAAAVLFYDHYGSPDMPDFPARLQPATRVAWTEKQLLQERPLIRALRAEPANEDLWVRLIALYIETGRRAPLRQAYDDALRSVPKPAILRETAFREWVERNAAETP